MSNNKQMKLYTEEHMKIFYHLGKVDGFIGRQDDVNELIKNYPPIELPSDEEILVPFPTEKDENFRDGKEIKMWMNGWEEGYKEALQSLRNKIQGGNNEQ